MKKAFPAWIKWKAPAPEVFQGMTGLLGGLKLHTVCESARCPNIGFCYSRQTATFLILGDVCSRRCAFCAVKKGIPLPVNEDEPSAVAEAVRRLGLHYVVITSVTRDDLADGGASQFVKTIERIRRWKKDILVEILIPDFQGSLEALEAVVQTGPQVVNHNMETVPRLYPTVRPGAAYERSRALLAKVKQMNRKIVTKSGLMVGLGETQSELIRVMRQLREAGCDLLTIGQYLQPSATHLEIMTFVTPGEFSHYEKVALEMGFGGVAAAPLARSSFKAEALYRKIIAN